MLNESSVTRAGFLHLIVMVLTARNAIFNCLCGLYSLPDLCRTTTTCHIVCHTVIDKQRIRYTEHGWRAERRGNYISDCRNGSCGDGGLLTDLSSRFHAPL